LKKQFLEAGRIVNTHGVRGEVKIEPWADEAAFLTRFKRFYLDGSPVAVRLCRVHKNTVIASLEGVDDLSAAMALGTRWFLSTARTRTCPEARCFYRT